MRDRRADPTIPTAPVTLTLFLGALLRLPSLLQIQGETSRRAWQHLIGLRRPISDDCLGYTLKRYDLEDLRGVLVKTNRRLKENKQLESAKIGGLLVVALDANEQFKSRSRCCDACCQRTIEETGEDGTKREVIEYYHRQVYAHLGGPRFSVILDLESIRPGEEEAAAALRLLGRMRRLYGVRFFDAVTVDAWYTKGPFIVAVQKMGWGVVTVLKQERFDVYKESTALMKESQPQKLTRAGRILELREVRDLTFTECQGSVRVVAAQEQWRAFVRRGDRKVAEAKKAEWRWLVTEELDECSTEQIWQAGHRRWAIENDGFNELTQHYHLEHCQCHEPTAILARLLILVLAMNLFELFARLHGKLVRAGKATLQQIFRQMDLAMERWEELKPLWSG